MTRIVTFMALLSLATTMEGLPAKLDMIPNIQNKEQSSSVHNRRTRFKKGPGEASSNMHTKPEMISDVEQILSQMEELSMDLSGPVTTVSDEDKMSIFLFAFRSTIETLSRSCPGAGLADLLTGHLRYIIYDLYENEQIENALNGFYNETEEINEDWNLFRKRVVRTKRNAVGFPPSRSKQNADPQLMRDNLVVKLFEITEDLGFPNSDQVFWDMGNYIYENALQNVQLRDFLQHILTQMIRPSHFTYQESCNERPTKTLGNLADKLSAASARLNQMSTYELYGVSPADVLVDETSSQAQKLMATYIEELDNFSRVFAQKMADIASLLTSQQTYTIEYELASEISSKTIHLIQLYWNAPNDNSEDSQYEYEYYGSLGSIEEILAQHGGKLYGLFSDCIRQMLVTLFQKFAEEAQNQGVNTDRFLDVLSKALDNLDVNTRY